MAPGSSSCINIPEFRPTNKESSMANNDLENIQFGKKTVATVTKLSKPSTSGMHELLECPVCTNSMYPLIHQVQSSHPIAKFMSELLLFDGIRS